MESIAEMGIGWNTRWASSHAPHRNLTRSGIERVIFMDDAVGIAIEFGGGNDGIAITGLEQGNADHQGAGEAACVALCDGE